MRQYTITKVTGKPDWSKIPSLDVDNYQWCEELDIKMKSQICYDENGLYVHLRAWEKDIRAELTEPMSMVCEDSCMEFFFRPMEGDLRYFNLEINPNGCIRLGFGPAGGLRTQLVPRDMEQLFSVESRRTEDGWTLTYAIPLTFVQLFYPDFYFRPGTVLRGNCYKCGDLTVQPHYYSWNPVEVENPDFHRSEFFGKLYFE